MAYNTNGVQSLIGDVKSDFGNKSLRQKKTTYRKNKQ